MTFAELRAFIEKRMRMSHIYQPVMLMALLRGRGACTDEKIAKSILPFDESQIDYYKNITNNMVERSHRTRQVTIFRMTIGFHLRSFNCDLMPLLRLREVSGVFFSAGR